MIEWIESLGGSINLAPLIKQFWWFPPAMCGGAIASVGISLARNRKIEGKMIPPTVILHPEEESKLKAKYEMMVDIMAIEKGYSDWENSITTEAGNFLKFAYSKLSGYYAEFLVVVGEAPQVDIENNQRLATFKKTLVGVMHKRIMPTLIEIITHPDIPLLTEGLKDAIIKDDILYVPLSDGDASWYANVLELILTETFDGLSDTWVDRFLSFKQFKDYVRNKEKLRSWSIQKDLIWKLTRVCDNIHKRNQRSPKEALQRWREKYLESGHIQLMKG